MEGTANSLKSPAEASEQGRPQLLVSVRNCQEALRARAGGADIIDLKEPTQGALGRPTNQVIREIVSLDWTDVPLSIAWGELHPNDLETLPCRVEAFMYLKVGLSHYHGADWHRDYTHMQDRLPRTTNLIPVLYADKHPFDAMTWEQCFTFLARQGTSTLLIDTYDKQNGRLSAYMSLPNLRQLTRMAAAHHVRLALAGSLNESLISRLVPLRIDVLGVRGAACHDGRMGHISTERVRSLRKTLQGFASV